MEKLGESLFRDEERDTGRDAARGREESHGERIKGLKGLLCNKGNSLRVIP